MGKLYSTIAVETDDSSAIVGFLQSQLGIEFSGGTSELTLGFHFDVYHAPAEWLHGADSLGHPLPEEEPFYGEFQVSTFKTLVDFYCDIESSMTACLHVVADAVGKAVSWGVNKRVLVFFDGTNIPFCLYEGGRRTTSFPKYSQVYMESRSWLPSGEYESDSCDSAMPVR
jgi:hypothetical protein